MQVTRSKDGSRILYAERRDEVGRVVQYRYFTNPSACQSYQEGRQGRLDAQNTVSVEHADHIKNDIVPAIQSDDAARQWISSRVIPKVQANWFRSPSSRPEYTCIVAIRTTATGQVVAIDVTKSSGDEAFDRSAEVAVRKASPLPMPGDPKIAEKLRFFSVTLQPGQPVTGPTALGILFHEIKEEPDEESEEHRLRQELSEEKKVGNDSAAPGEWYGIAVGMDGCIKTDTITPAAYMGLIIDSGRKPEVTDTKDAQGNLVKVDISVDINGLQYSKRTFYKSEAACLEDLRKRTDIPDRYK